jgi:hypothetical protein
MQMHGIVMTAELVEAPNDPNSVEVHLMVQGVKPGQPRRVVIPMSVLVAQPDIEPEAIRGHGFEAEVIEEGPKRWIVESIQFAARSVLRPE